MLPLRLSILCVLALAQDPTIRVATRLVQVNVVVHGSHGPVSGLKKEDFKIFDKGKEQKVAVFNVSDSSAKPAAAAKAVSPAPPGVFTNRLSSRADAPISATVLLIDVLNTEVADQQTAQKQILKFIASLDPNRRVAIYILGRRLRVLQDFTDDPNLLRKAVMKSRGEHSGVLAGAAQPTPGGPVTLDEDSGKDPENPATSAMREAMGEMRDAYNIDRVGLTLAAMEQIGNHLAQVPGRKSLIWISSSFPFFLINDERHNFMAANRENRTFSQETDNASRALSAADVAIYPVDARGLLGAPDYDVTQPGNAIVNPSRGRAFGTKGNGQLGAVSVDTPEGFESMRALAEGTGGRAFFNTNDIKGAIGHAISDADVSYTLGFYVDSSAVDGFHEIKVKVDRSGVDVRYRKGYLAESRKQPKETDIAAILHDTASSSLDATAVGLIAAIDEPSPGSYRLALHINFEDLSLEKQNGKWTGEVDIAYISQSAQGRTLASTTKKITFSLTDEAYAAKRRDGLILEQIIDHPKDATRVRVAVLDQRSGATGSVSVATNQKTNFKPN